MSIVASSTPSRTAAGPFAAALVVALLLVGCGGSSEEAEPAPDQTGSLSGAPSTTVTEGDDPDEPADVERADEATAAEARSLVFELEDLPDGWVVATEAQPYATEGIAVDACYNPPGGLLAELPLGAAAAGPTVKPAEYDFFLTSWAATFADEDDASAWATDLDTPERSACQARAMESANAEGTTELEVREIELDREAARIGLDQRVAAHGYEFVEGGEITSTLYLDSYRVGRSIVTIQIQLGPVSREQADAALAVEADLRGRTFEAAGALEGS